VVDRCANLRAQHADAVTATEEREVAGYHIVKQGQELGFHAALLG
jgi:hypothetical protein